MELRYGLELNPKHAPKVEPAIASILSSVTILPFGTVEASRLLKSVLFSNLMGNPSVLMMS
ncbi:MAG TPA: hypothetical protein V6C65_31860 [Allocoleopsis sp.]